MVKIIFLFCVCVGFSAIQGFPGGKSDEEKKSEVCSLKDQKIARVKNDIKTAESLMNQSIDTYNEMREIHQKYVTMFARYKELFSYINETNKKSINLWHNEWNITLAIDNVTQASDDVNKFFEKLPSSGHIQTAYANFNNTKALYTWEKNILIGYCSENSLSLEWEYLFINMDTIRERMDESIKALNKITYLLNDDKKNLTNYFEENFNLTNLREQCWDIEEKLISETKIINEIDRRTKLFLFALNRIQVPIENCTTNHTFVKVDDFWEEANSLYKKVPSINVFSKFTKEIKESIVNLTAEFARVMQNKNNTTINNGSCSNITPDLQNEIQNFINDSNNNITIIFQNGSNFINTAQYEKNAILEPISRIEQKIRDCCNNIAIEDCPNVENSKQEDVGTIISKLSEIELCGNQTRQGMYELEEIKERSEKYSEALFKLCPPLQ